LGGCSIGFNDNSEVTYFLLGHSVRVYHIDLPGGPKK